MPAFYGRMPDELQIISGSSITTTVIIVFLLNLLFNVFTRPGQPPAPPSAQAPADQAPADRAPADRAAADRAPAE